LQIGVGVCVVLCVVCFNEICLKGHRFVHKWSLYCQARLNALTK